MWNCCDVEIGARVVDFSDFGVAGHSRQSLTPVTFHKEELLRSGKVSERP